MDLFVTGTTGFVGRYLAIRLLGRPGEHRLRCLVRADNAEHGHQRLRDSIGRLIDGEALDAVMARVDAVVGDLTKPNLGLSDADRASVLQDCDTFLHAAADVRFNQPLQDARDRNVAGTRRVAELARASAEAGKLKRLDWVGTAFVAGLRRDLVAEGDLEHDAGWKNSYEQSKYEAELLLHEEFGDLPLTVFRPSIVVGESSSGSTSNFGMLYWPVQLYARGWWRTVVGRKDTPVDLVPVDFVADAIEALSRPDQPTGGRYHLCAGPDGNRTIGQLATLVESYFDGGGARYMDPDTFNRWVRPFVDLFMHGRRGKVLKSGGRFFIEYMKGNPIFDITESSRALAALGVELPTVEDYFGTLLDYAVQTDWGRKPAA